MLLAVLTLGSTVSALAAQPASAASNGLWSVFPTTLHGQAPRAFVRPMLTPGKGYEDSVTVANYTSAPLTFNLYSADAINTRGGGLSLKRRTDLQTDIGKWIRLPYQRLTVPAHGASIVPFIVEAPINATPGDHVGGIVAEDTQGTTTKSGSVPVTVIEAVGVRVRASRRPPPSRACALARVVARLGVRRGPIRGFRRHLREVHTSQLRQHSAVAPHPRGADVAFRHRGAAQPQDRPASPWKRRELCGDDGRHWRVRPPAGPGDRGQRSSQSKCHRSGVVAAMGVACHPGPAAVASVCRSVAARSAATAAKATRTTQPGSPFFVGNLRATRNRCGRGRG